MSYHIPSGSYNTEIKFTQNSTEEYSAIYLTLEVESSIVSVACIIITFISLLLMLIISMTSKSVFLLKNSLLSMQLMYITSLTPIILTPTYALYIQSMGLLSFNLGYLNHFMHGIMGQIGMDAYYTSGYESYNALANLIVPIFGTLLFILPYAIWFVIYEEYNKNNKRTQANGKYYHLKKLKILLYIVVYLSPIVWISLYMQIHAWKADELADFTGMAIAFPLFLTFPIFAF